MLKIKEGVYIDTAAPLVEYSHLYADWVGAMTVAAFLVGVLTALAVRAACEGVHRLARSLGLDVEPLDGGG